MNSVSLTFFIDFQLQHVADLGEDVVGEGGQEGDALQEVQLVLHLLDAGSLHQPEVSIMIMWSVLRSQLPIRGQYCGHGTNQRSVLWSQ